MNNNELKTIEQIKEYCNSLFSTPDYEEVIENVANNVTDFQVNEVRFISADCIHEVLEDELACDEYLLGCFNADAIADATGWPIALIEAAQKGEQYEEIGKAMTGEHVAELARIYSSADGYGHHFNQYDGNEETVIIRGNEYYVFDNH